MVDCPDVVSPRVPNSVVTSSSSRPWAARLEVRSIELITSLLRSRLTLGRVSAGDLGHFNKPEI
jgi:hypothetical protein